MKKYLKLIIAVVSAAFCSMLVFTSVENKVADWFQRPLKKLNESKSVVMVNVDDYSVENIGTWPFSRDVYAEMLVALRELGAESAVFDLSFLDKSPAKVDEKYVKEDLPSYVAESFRNVDGNIDNIVDGVAEKAFSSKDAREYLHGVTEEAQNSINTSISYVIRSQDALLANALTFFGNSYLTLTIDNNSLVGDDEFEYVESYIPLDNITGKNDTKTPNHFGVQPAINELLVHAKKAGFVNADPDRDGYMRRLNLVLKLNGRYYGQLVFVPILNRFGNPEIEVTNRKIILKDAKLPDGSVKDVWILRDRHGSTILKYPRKSYVDYNNTSLWNIYRLSLLDKQLYGLVYEMQQNGLLEAWDGDDPVELYQSANYLKEALYSGENMDEGITYEAFSTYRKQYFDTVKTILSGEVKAAMDGIYAGDEETVAYIDEYYDYAKELFDSFDTSFQNMKEKLSGALCIIGTNATSTTDYGLNQYEEHYPNPGVHYTMANQLLSQDFVSDSPVFISIVIAFILCLAYGFVSFRMESIGKQILIGTVSIAGSVLLLILFFLVTKVYIGSAVPILSITCTFIGITVMNLLTTSKDKKFIKAAFSQCLSPDVVDEIVKNPDSFKLGGQKVDMTAIFTDIQKFSSFSELLTAGQLVALLNFYLTEMSDIIMDQRGTVDKYEGDAIVAFVGAPVKTAEHAALACRAAINMKKAESRMNKHIEEIASGEKPEDMDQETYEAFCIMVKNNKKIFTRIGLNSGEIVAGYMGSTNKKNYTMMGNNVNLASRLEGVNKQYRTGGILMSAATREGLDERFIVRSLDRVQVVNVVTPIRLYELLELADEADEKLVKYVEAWEKTMKVFEEGNYAKALEYFRKLSEARPSDNVAKYYIELIEKFFIKGSYPTENDDFGVAFNPENPEGMNEAWVGTPYEIKGTFKLLQK